MCSRLKPARHKREYEGFLERILHRGELASRASRRSHKRDANEECMARSAGGSEGPGPPAERPEELRAIVRK